MSQLEIRPLVGQQVISYIPDLAKLRIQVFREYPYLYDGTIEYEEKYLKSYVNSPESLVVVVFSAGKVVGASTGVPLEDAQEEFQKPFIDGGYNPKSIFYFGESVLQKDFRGRGIGVRFFQEREGYAISLKRFEYTAFCAVDRHENHPRKPADYVPLDAFWNRRGYIKKPEMITWFPWKEIDESEETLKSMTYWMKRLKF